MNMINTLARDLEAAKLETANRWPDQIKPLIQAYLDLGALLDRLELGFNGWKPVGAHEELMAQVHSALAKDHGALRRDIQDYREDRIDDAHSWQGGSDDDWDRYDATRDALLDLAVSVDDAVKAVAL